MPLLSGKQTHSAQRTITANTSSREAVAKATDICEYNGKQYLVISDYYSRYLEILHSPTTTAEQIVRLIKATCARFGLRR